MMMSRRRATVAGAVDAGDRGPVRIARAACQKHVCDYWGPGRSAAEEQICAKNGDSQGDLSYAAALAPGLLDGFLRDLSDLWFPPRVVCSPGWCDLHAAS